MAGKPLWLRAVVHPVWHWVTPACLPFALYSVATAPRSNSSWILLASVLYACGVQSWVRRLDAKRERDARQNPAKSQHGGPAPLFEAILEAERDGLLGRQ